MRLLTTLVATLPTLALAQQAPLMDQAKGWFDKAASFVQSATSSNPVDAAAAAVAAHGVTPLTFDNYHQVVSHSGAIKPYNPPEAWMVYITGANKTCPRGMCERMDKAWNESVLLFKADISAPKLAIINCDESELICGAWGARTGSIWFILVPQPDQVDATVDITIFPLNFTTVDAGDITRIHTRKQYLYADKYEHALHPFDGWVVKTGLIYPMAYALWAFAKIPSYVFMIGISFLSRNLMGRRMQGQQSAAAPGAAPAGGAAAPAAAR